MPKAYILISVLIIIIVIIFIFRLLSSKPQSQLPTADININGHQYTLEIAKTPTSQAKGLGGRESLCPDCGMIFVFPFQGIYPFWMKDTLIPLDMIWLDSSGKVVTILTAQPEPGVSTLKLKNYTNTSPAKYVIELNAGDSVKLNLKVNDVISLPNL